MTTLTLTRISRAAIKQNWVVERTGKNHRKLIPPDKEKQIVVTSGTPSDSRALDNFLAQMKRSGFIWPPPKPVKVPANHRDGGVSCESVDAASVGFNEENSGVEVVTSDAQLTGAESVDHVGDQDDWVDVVWENPLKPGYRVNKAADVMSPSGRVLSPHLNGNHVGVYLQVSVRGEYVERRVRLDKLMLWSFVGGPASSHAKPVHRSGDPLDCSLGNLCWSEPPTTVRNSPTAVVVNKDSATDDASTEHATEHETIAVRAATLEVDEADKSVFRSGGQLKEFGPRPRIATAKPTRLVDTALDKQLRKVDRTEFVEIKFGSAGVVVVDVDLRWMELTVEKMVAVRNAIETLRALGYDDSYPEGADDDRHAD